MKQRLQIDHTVFPDEQLGFNDWAIFIRESTNKAFSVTRQHSDTTCDKKLFHGS